MAYVIAGNRIKDDACIEVCPVDAIFAPTEILDKYDYAEGLNAQFFLERAPAAAE